MERAVHGRAPYIPSRRVGPVTSLLIVVQRACHGTDAPSQSAPVHRLPAALGCVASPSQAPSVGLLSPFSEDALQVSSA